MKGNNRPGSDRHLATVRVRKLKSIETIIRNASISIELKIRGSVFPFDTFDLTQEQALTVYRRLHSILSDDLGPLGLDQKKRR